MKKRQIIKAFCQASQNYSHGGQMPPRLKSSWQWVTLRMHSLFWISASSTIAAYWLHDFGKDYSNRDNVVHIELKQWSNNTVLSTSTAGNFSVQENYSVSALTGGCFQTVVHPSQQVRGYNGYLTHFVEVISSGQLSLTGVAYCYNYLRNAEPSTLYSDQFKKLQSEFRTYAQDEVKELAEKLHGILCNGDGERIYNKILLSAKS